MPAPPTDPSPPPSGTDGPSPLGGAAPGADLFDALYPRLLAPFHTEREARREVAALRELLGLSLSDRILDLGCGWGRHLALLRDAGHGLVGLDVSPALLALAPATPVEERAAAGADPAETGPLPGAGSASLVAGDMRRLPLADASFDVVLNLATSLGLFLEDAAAVEALAEARRVLRPGGRLLVEGMHRDDVVAGFAPRASWTLEDGTKVRARRRFDAVAGVSHEVLRWKGPLGSGEKRHALRIRTATELAGLVHGAGLVVRGAWGGWGGQRFRHDSERLVLLAERPEAPSRVAAPPA